jgi:hypothetical protein
MARIDKQRRVIGSGAQRESTFSPPPVFAKRPLGGLKSNRKSEDQDRWQGRIDECALRPFHNIHRGLHVLFA